MELRFPKYQWSRIQRHGQDIPDLRLSPQSNILLKMQEPRRGRA